MIVIITPRWVGEYPNRLLANEEILRLDRNGTPFTVLDETGDMRATRNHRRLVVASLMVTAVGIGMWWPFMWVHA